jgi:RIO kinase 3
VREDQEQAAPAPVVVATAGGHDVDADLALAVQLQQEFDRDRAELDIQRAQTRHLSQYSKVVLDSDLLLGGNINNNGAAAAVPQRSGRRWDAENAESCSDDETDDEEESAGGEGGAEEGAAGEEGADGAVVWRTKHDAEICGLRNTEYFEETHPNHNLGNLEDVKLSNPVFNTMMLHAERANSRSVRKRFGKSEQATREQVMDPKTRVMLFKMINAGTLSEVNGAVSTGKESVVYHARGGAGEEYAVKIFKTTLNEFKARAKYVEGEHRFRHQMTRFNPRKIIRLWAEKELRNLKRAEKAGLRCPRAVLLKEHVLVMQFVGEDGLAAPKLLDANLSKPATARLAYTQCVAMMRTLYRECHLVHADLSEFNMLWRHKQLWIIDLAQAVEHEHPNALRFLRDDCLHVTQFFRSRGVGKECLSVRRLFEFVSGEKELALEAEMAAASEQDTSDEQLMKDNVWFEAFLPQRLSDLRDPEAAGSQQDMFHGAMLEGGDKEQQEDDEEEEEEEEEDKALEARAAELVLRRAVVVQPNAAPALTKAEKKQQGKKKSKRRNKH